MEVSELITERNILAFSLQGERDVMRCRVCGQSEVIPNEYIGGAKLSTETGEKMSLVLGRAERRKWIRQFQTEHVKKCLQGRR